MMRNNRSVLLISAIALILVALVPAVSADTIIYDEELFEFIDTSKSGEIPADPHSSAPYYDTRSIVFKDITKAQVLDFLVFELTGDRGWWLDGTKIQDGRHEFTYHFNGADRPGVLYLNRKTDSSGQITSTQFTISLKDWDIGDLRGKQIIKMPFIFHNGMAAGGRNVATNTYIACTDTSPERIPVSKIIITEKTGIMWKHRLRVTSDINSYHIYINGFIDGHKYTGEVALKKGAEIYAKFTNPGEAIHRSVLKSEIDLIEITSPSGGEYAYPLYEGIPPKARTVTVTMTDVDGNHISGFDVKAVNLYTGKEYTTSTDSDIAYITLPLDRIATVPNPQTGQYEEAPVGTYIFYGYKSGYKMEPGYGIMVNVLPEKYLPDVFCDIIVTKEDEKLRTVTVTMRDIDGNTIRGFEVRAVNAYTGETYTEVTNSDVAYITLPMDRIATVPNPETGEYEEAPVGYYNFYGTKPGYKMFPDYAIRVNVLPEKYMPDVFCEFIVAPDGTFPDDPYNSPVIVSVRNSQTGALLADARVIIQDTRTDPWTEVINQTLPSGQGTFYLPNDPGSNPNQYYITALLPGYNDIYNGRYFRVAGPIYIHIYMEPIEGGPVDENKTFLEFYVRDPDGNPVSDAVVSVSVADEARLTNAQGWTQFEVPKNAAYSYTVRKSGYSTIEGSVTVGDGPRYTVNVVLNPTQPPGPGVPTPPPTTQPPGVVPGDDGSQGFLSEAVRGISKIFGVGFATGKTILGMLLALAIGFTTAKKLRGGAAEFGFGLLGGMMLGVLIGLLPVWTVVVLLLIVGMYIGYRYVGGGSNG